MSPHCAFKPVLSNSKNQTLTQIPKFKNVEENSTVDLQYIWYSFYVVWVNSILEIKMRNYQKEMHLEPERPSVLRSLEVNQARLPGLCTVLRASVIRYPGYNTHHHYWSCWRVWEYRSDHKYSVITICKCNASQVQGRSWV